jgi:pimeloyl-ACP methyl ester carboxylesterase
MGVDAQRRDEEQPMSEPRAHDFRLHGVAVHLREAGAGEPVLFLHGAGGVQDWAPFMDALSDRHRLLVPDHPWFGGSGSPEWIESVGDLAYFYLDLLGALGLAGAHVIGNSLGGWIAAEMAVRDTRRLASLTLLAPAGLHLRGVPKGDIFLWNAEQTVRNLFARPEYVEAALARTMDESALELALKNRLATARFGWQPRLYNPDLHKWLHRVDVPTLILWGDSDRIIPPAYADAFASRIPGARVRVLERCGHVPQIECAQEFLAEVGALVAEAGR